MEPPVDSKSARGIEDDRNRHERDQNTMCEHPDRAAQQAVVHEVEDDDTRANPGCEAEPDGNALNSSPHPKRVANTAKFGTTTARRNGL